MGDSPFFVFVRDKEFLHLLLFKLCLVDFVLLTSVVLVDIVVLFYHPVFEGKQNVVLVAYVVLIRVVKIGPVIWSVVVLARTTPAVAVVVFSYNA